MTVKTKERISSASDIGNITERLRIWHKSPRKFVEQGLNVKPEKWQIKAMEAIRDNDRVAIKSGHGVGKSALLAWTILWWLLTRHPAKIACTAPTSHQLDDVLWGEVSKWSRQLPEGLKSLISVTSEKVFLNADPRQSFAVARTARKEKPEAFQGFHSDNMLFIADEASGVEPIIFEVAEGVMTEEGAKTLLTGNPTRTSGVFYDCFHKMREYWKCLSVPCKESTRVKPLYYEQMEKKYGIDSNVYRVRVLGDFPRDDDDSVIPLSAVEASIGRDVQVPDSEPVVWGLDVARFGSDKTALAIRKGRILVGKIDKWQGKDLMQTCGIIFNKYEKAKKFKPECPKEILVDSIGIGAGVVDRLREMGLPARGVNVAEAASIDTMYNRLRDELWFQVRDWFLSQEVAIEDDEELIAELTTVKYAYTNLGKLKVEAKDEMKKRGLHSPDLADAVCLSFAYQHSRTYDTKLVYPPIGIV